MAISPPPRDQNGRVTPHDHPEIKAEHRVIRRISEEMVVAGRKGKRISSAALQFSSLQEDPYCGMSVDIEPFMNADGIDPRRHVTTPQFVGSIALEVSSLRSRQLLVGYDPLPENKYHGGVWAKSDKPRLTRGIQRALLKEATWFVAIGEVALVED